MFKARNFIEPLLEKAGIAINGPGPQDMQVHDQRIFGRMLRHKNLGLGEGYMQGWWDCRRIDEFICRLLIAEADKRVQDSLLLCLANLPRKFINLQTKRGARHVARRHYDLSNDLFLSFLDQNKQYSCAYFINGDDLEQAQIRKLEMICNKLELGPQDSLLDIGCGWGGLARYAAETRGCQVTAVNISREQTDYAAQYCAGLPVKIERKDYREVQGRFSKIVSVGMFEHVGRKNHRIFMNTVHRLLDSRGILLLHTIGDNESKDRCDPWISKYIFPRGLVPGIADMAKAADGLFVMEDWHNFGPHYDKTLMAWQANFEKSWNNLSLGFGKTFKRMWNYYLLSCAGAFRARSMQLWQIVFTKQGMRQPYCRL